VREVVSQVRQHVVPVGVVAALDVLERRGHPGGEQQEGVEPDRRVEVRVLGVDEPPDVFGVAALVQQQRGEPEAVGVAPGVDVHPGLLLQQVTQETGVGVAAVPQQQAQHLFPRRVVRVAGVTVLVAGLGVGEFAPPLRVAAPVVQEGRHGRRR
jgi:hypothetical protein